MKYFCKELNSNLYQKKTIIEITSLIEARELLQSTTKRVIITNPKGSTKYLGFMLIDYIFDILLQEFPIIEYAILQTNEDNAAKFSAIKLNYTDFVSIKSSDQLFNSL